MKKLLALAFLLLLSGCKAPISKSIVMLKGNGYSCTGFEMTAPSGKDYLVTAGHCSALEDAQGSITVITEDGATLQRKAISLDTTADVLLLEPVPSIPALTMADSTYPGEKVHVLGHGYALPLWDSYGAIIGEFNVPGTPWVETISSAVVAPGHSGSPVLDPSGNVIGVVSVGSDAISGFVRLQDLKSFLQGY